MSLASFVVVSYGVFTLVGGLIGYVKAKSTASLIAGTIAGTALLFCTYGIAHGSRVAVIIAGIIALLLGGRFAMTWPRTRCLMPDLLMIILSGVTLLTLGWTLLIR